MTPQETDIALIGAGIMSATLGTLLKELAPEKSIAVFEKLSAPALESSHELNNAGTGHAALCELNYTPEQSDGSVTINRAVGINEKFHLSLQAWAHWVKQGKLQEPREFIRRLPHMSFVTGAKDVQFLKTRYAALSQHPLFAGMEFAEDAETLQQWIPLMMNQRTDSQPIAATRILTGTDMNFGALTRKLFDYLTNNGVSLNCSQSIKALNRLQDGRWSLTVVDENTGEMRVHLAKFVFIGCGGGSLSLLQKSHIPESEHIGGFPVSGLFLKCKNDEVAAKHHAKVYGKAKVGAPPMSVPHLDTRFVDGKKTLLFGPFAGFTPKFLKEGSLLDLPLSVRPNNLCTMLTAASKNVALTKYLMEQVLLTKEQRMADLREFVPDARDEDWELITAGQRVQIIKNNAQGSGELQFGTEVVCAADGSLAALLGASPGASTSVHAMVEVLQKCFSGSLNGLDEKLREMMPSLGLSLADDLTLLQQVRVDVEEQLQLAD
ncbi:malate dehydrogenase (quinone) [Kingella negevensis]|uniref:Probable malate:quinone oxidoreductase n=2 Tax=Kingella negevensis TaxID=1522312 RepID=A0A238TAZ4_9NEIS|nr:malate dehydrogenase (quinone) [Kingella negevensis]MDK4697697.1 malate dehydrogenase (quinone) [Kingella negevensis]SNB67554.1 putative malate:quinone oxidoreductase 1 [Kingella negevensis]